MKALPRAATPLVMTSWPFARRAPIAVSAVFSFHALRLEHHYLGDCPIDAAQLRRSFAAFFNSAMRVLKLGWLVSMG